MSNHSIRLLMLILLASPAFVRAEAEPLPTSDELHKLFNDGQYQTLLTKLAKVQPLNGKAAEPYDKLDLAILKTNALIAMKNHGSATRSAAEAAKLATDDPSAKRANEALALQALLKASPKLTYAAKGANGQPGTPISIEVATRDGAYRALLADLQSEATAVVRAAKDGKALPPIAVAMAKLNETSPLEKYLNKNDTAVQKTIDELSTQSTKLITDAMTPVDKRVEKIKTDANSIITTRTGQPDGSVRIDKRKRGLMNQEPNELRDLASTADSVQGACRDLAKLSPRHAKEFEKLFTDAAGAGNDARKLLKTFRP